MTRPFLEFGPGSDRARRRWQPWVPVFLYMLALFVASSMTTLPSPPGRLSDKHVHVFAYAGLSALAIRAAAGGTWSGLSSRTIATGMAVASVYGLSDEIHQRFVPGRESSVWDFAADVLGAGLAAMGAGAWGIIRDRQRAR